MTMTSLMKFKFKVQPYQTNAVDSVVDCFAGQVNTSQTTYTIDPGKAPIPLEFTGFKNADLFLTESQLKENIHEVQQRQNLPLSEALISSAKCRVNLDIEMETGTGKTYCYIKTIFELNKLYGWSKFIIVVPSIAIREGVYKSLEITADHFTENFGKKVRFFIYNSKQLHQIESLSGLNNSSACGCSLFSSHTSRHERRISTRARSRTSSLVVFSHNTSSSIILNNRLRSIAASFLFLPYLNPPPC